MRVFEVTRIFPPEERYSMVDQMRRSSRSVCTNLAEGWRKRRYEAQLVSKLSDAKSEAEETRVWVEFAVRCDYITPELKDDLDSAYDTILAQLVRLISDPKPWLIR